MSKVTLSGAMPAEEMNGLDPIEDGLLSDPGKVRVAVVRLSVSKIVNNLDRSDTYPVVRLAQIEPLAGKAADAAEKLLTQARFDRTGSETLPLDELDEGDED